MAAHAPEKPAEAAKHAEPALTHAAGGGGTKAMLPLILNIVLMPAIAFAMTQFVLLPKLNSKPSADAAHGGEAGEEAHAEEAPAHGEAKADKGHGGDAKADKGHGAKPPKGSKILVPLSSKIIVNVAGTMGTRYMVANITLVGTRSDLKELVERQDSQLRDVASSALASRSIVDLEKPGARNLIRSELVSAFNTVMGDGVVHEIYLTEFAVQ